MVSVGTQPHAPESSGFGEFIALMAVAMSLVALSIDMMLPAFPEMTRDLRPPSPNDIQLVISLMFVGVAVGLPFYGRGMEDSDVD